MQHDACVSMGPHGPFHEMSGGSMTEARQSSTAKCVRTGPMRGPGRCTLPHTRNLWTVDGVCDVRALPLPKNTHITLHLARIDFPQNLQSPRRGPRPSGPAPSPAQVHQQLRSRRKIERSKSVPWAASMGRLLIKRPVMGSPAAQGTRENVHRPCPRLRSPQPHERPVCSRCALCCRPRGPPARGLSVRRRSAPLRAALRTVRRASPIGIGAPVLPVGQGGQSGPATATSTCGLQRGMAGPARARGR